MGRRSLENLRVKNPPPVNIQESRNPVKRVPFSTARSLTFYFPDAAGGLVRTGGILGSGLEMPRQSIRLTRQFYSLGKEPQTERKFSRLHLQKKSSLVSCHGHGTVPGFRVFK